MNGEICIRHKFKGENIFLVSERFDPRSYEYEYQGIP